jgi:hypothetical protein
MITKGPKAKKIVVYHKLASDEGALAMMCARDEEPQLNVVSH